MKKTLKALAALLVLALALTAQLQLGAVVS